MNANEIISFNFSLHFWNYAVSSRLFENYAILHPKLCISIIRLYSQNKIAAKWTKYHVPHIIIEHRTFLPGLNVEIYEFPVEPGAKLS